MEKFKGTLNENIDRRYWDLLRKVLVVVLILSTGCMAQFTVTVSDVKKYALDGQNATFIYTITGDPDELRVKIQTSKHQYAVIFKITSINGTITKDLQNVRKSNVLQRYNGRVSVKYYKPNLEFHLSNITDADFGWIYKVEVKNEGEYQSVQKGIKLIKAVKPKITPASFFPKKFIKLGARDEFVCRANGTPEAYIRWMNGKKTLSMGYKDVPLVIKNAQINSTANYDCIAGNIGGTVKKTLSLFVSYIQYGPEKKVTSKHIYVTNGGEIDEKCNVDGYPKLEYKWINPSNHVIRTSRVLAIGNINKNQFGNYTCEAENHAGTLEYVVEVKEKKDAMKTPKPDVLEVKNLAPVMVESPLCILSSLLTMLIYCFFT